MGPFAPGWTEQDVEAALERADPQELLYVPILVGVNAADCERERAEDICLRLAEHPHFNVRGNAILGLGHIARTCRMLNTQAAVPAIASALRDEHEFVRGHARSAVEDLRMYLGAVVPEMDGDNDRSRLP
jgi:HEAT repeat protein